MQDHGRLRQLALGQYKQSWNRCQARYLAFLLEDVGAILSE